MTLFSDSAIPESLKNDFKSGMAKLVASFNGNFDYHPGSDEAVVDLVHPSLFVAQHNVTPVVINGTLEVAKFFKITKYIFSNRFCYDSKDSSGYLHC